MKKILLFVPTLNGGGAEKSTVLLANELAKTYDITLLTRCSGVYENIINPKVKHINFNKNKMIWAFLPMCSYFMKNRNFDIVISSMHYANLYILLSKILTKYKSKNIVTLRNLTSKRIKDRFLSKLITKFLYSYADNIVSISKAVENDFQNYYNVKGEYNIIGNPIKILGDIDLVGRDRVSNILTVGRLEKIKNLDQLLKFLIELKKETPDVKLQIVGSGSEKKNLEFIIEKNNLNENVTINDFTLDLKKFYSKTEVYISFSENEGLGNTIIEALIENIPTFVKKGSGGAEEIIKKHVNNPENFIFSNITDLKNKYYLYNENKIFTISESIDKYKPSYIAKKYEELF